MKNTKISAILITTLTVIFSVKSFAETPLPSPTPQIATPTPNAAVPTLNIPAPPALSAKAYVIMDGASQQILASQNASQKLPPASLTKMMTSYVISRALKEGRIHFEDQVRISEKAWKMGGSKMFVKIGTTVSIRELLQGIIVDSGNDACVAMAEHVAGTEDAFVDLMNQQAKALGMNDTHFTDSTGMPNPDHYTTAHDLALLARALIYDFPEDYKWYSQKWFTYNGIKQPNRNRLLWRDPHVDGVKTGHTDEAGFCLVASKLENGKRIISVLMGASNDAQRADDSERLLSYGTRFFEVHKIYAARTALKSVPVWKGKEKTVSVGVAEDAFVTVAPNQWSQVTVTENIQSPLIAPLNKDQVVGETVVELNHKVLARVPLISLEAVPEGHIWTRASDAIRLWIKHFFNHQ